MPTSTLHVRFKKQSYLSISFALLLFLGFVRSDQPTIHFAEYAYSGISLDISTITENARANHWRPDGSVFYVTGRETENVVSYTVSEPWNLSAATQRNTFDLSNDIGTKSSQSVAHGLLLRDDGLMMWVFNRTEIWGFELETAWDISSAKSIHHKDLSLFVQRGHDFDFNSDGTRIYIDDRNAQAVHEAHLSTPWDITTLEWVYSLDISDQEKAVRGIELIADGSIMLLLDTDRREVLQYHLSTPYDVKSAKFVDAFDVSKETRNPRGLSIHPEHDHFYITGTDKQRVFQYSRK